MKAELAKGEKLNYPTAVRCNSLFNCIIELLKVFSNSENEQRVAESIDLKENKLNVLMRLSVTKNHTVTNSLELKSVTSRPTLQ